MDTRAGVTKFIDGKAARLAVRSGAWTGPTACLAPGYAQANFVALPSRYAFDFLLFCQRNRKACPVLDVCEAGSTTAARVATDSDVRRDIPRYRIYEHGRLVAEPADLLDCWDDDYVSFLIGCSFSFEGALLAAGLPVRHIEQGCNVPMYRTNRSCVSAGPFSGELVVSMRPMPGPLVATASEVTARFPEVHGSPVYSGNPAALGIRDLSQPDFGDAVDVRPGEVPVFWACGVTSQAALMNAGLERVITHAPGHMFITDLRDDELASI